MKNMHLNMQSFSDLHELNEMELATIEGGSFWEDLAYAAGVTLRCFREFTSKASAFQASLPAHLKK